MMIINFIIQWKDEVESKTDLAGKVKDMLTDLERFNDVSDDGFSYNADDNSLHPIEYQLSEKENKAYFQIISTESESRAANTLSSIREYISKGHHRKDFLIICSYDEASLFYCCKLMLPMGIFERHLRELMYLITTKAFGVDWVEKTFPEEMIKGIKERTKGKLNNERITESAFEYLDYGEITSYLFSKRYFDCSPEQLLEDTLSDQSLNNLSRDEIIAIISSHRKTTLWDKLFSNINEVGEKTINTIREYRNDVMHHHTLKDTNYKEIRKEVKRTDKIIIQAIVDIENKIYTEEESRMIYSSAGYAIAEMMKAVNFSAKINIPDLTSYIYSTFEKLAERYNDFYSKIDYSSALKMISESMSTLSDYSKQLTNMNASTLELQHDSLHNEISSDVFKSDEKKDGTILNENKLDDNKD